MSVRLAQVPRLRRHEMSDDPIMNSDTSEVRHAEAARGLVHDGRTGSLATLTATGEPFGSVVSYGIDDRGQPVLCISELAEHTANARRDPRASLLVAATVAPDDDPLAAGRVTLVGRLVAIPAEAVADLRGPYLERNPYAAGFVSYGDFGWWRLEITSVRYVGGYGRMGWVDPELYAAARPDPIRHLAAGAIEHLNDDHAEHMLLVAQVLAGRPDAVSATTTGIDRHGVELVMDLGGETAWSRVSFAAPADDGMAMRKAVVALVDLARISEPAPPVQPADAAAAATAEAGGSPGHLLA